MHTLACFVLVAGVHTRSVGGVTLSGICASPPARGRRRLRFSARQARQPTESGRERLSKASARAPLLILSRTMRRNDAVLLNVHASPTLVSPPRHLVICTIPTLVKRKLLFNQVGVIIICSYSLASRHFACARLREQIKFQCVAYMLVDSALRAACEGAPPAVRSELAAIEEEKTRPLAP